LLGCCCCISGNSARTIYKRTLLDEIFECSACTQLLLYIIIIIIYHFACYVYASACVYNMQKVRVCFAQKINGPGGADAFAAMRKLVASATWLFVHGRSLFLHRHRPALVQQYIISFYFFSRFSFFLPATRSNRFSMVNNTVWKLAATQNIRALCVVRRVSAVEKRRVAAVASEMYGCCRRVGGGAQYHRSRTSGVIYYYYYMVWR
jgi:hypothetical protein